MASAALVVAVGAGLVSCGVAPGGTAERTLTVEGDPSADAALFARAASATAAIPTHRSWVEVSTSGGRGPDTTVTAEAEVDVESRRSRVVLSADPAGPFGGADGLVSEIVVDDGVVYSRSPALSPGSADRWIRLDTTAITDAFGGTDLDQLTHGMGGSSVTSVLDLLEQFGGEVTEVGPDEVRGVATRRYRAELHPAEVLERAGEAAHPELKALLDGLDAQARDLEAIPVEVWIDGDELVRRVELVVRHGDGAAAVELRQTFELYDLGAPIDIEVPDESEVDAFDPATLFGDLFGKPDD